MSMIEPIVVEIGYKRSGVGSGEIDYAVSVKHIDSMGAKSLQSLLDTLDEIKNCCTITQRRKELGL
jgi:hypothetical protein